MTELQRLLEALKKANHPEDIFGLEKGSSDKVYHAVQKVFRRLAKCIHKVRLMGNPKDVADTTEAQRLLNVFWHTAQDKIKGGIYGDKKAELSPKPTEDPALVQFSSPKYVYTVGNRIYSGGTCGVFRGTIQDKKSVVSSALFKVPHSIKDNDLMEREARAFDLFRKKAKSLASNPAGQETARKFLLRMPELHESVRIDDGSGKKTVNIFLIQPGFDKGWYTLEEIRKTYPSGVSTRHMTFIWNRVLEGLTLAHYSGVVHSALTPNHILIHAKDHLGQILDWTASCKISSGEKVPYTDDRYQAYFPEELKSTSMLPSPASDIYMSAWCMVYILGGSSEEKVIPDSVEMPIRELLNRCLQPKSVRRPQTADAVYTEFRQITKAVFGPKRFVELVMT